MNKTLSDSISVNSKFCRSVNLEKDFLDAEMLKGYICSSSTELIIKNVIDNITDNNHQTAFTWTGPYGSGKSSLAVFLSVLFGKNIELREIASKKLSTKVRNEFKKKIEVTTGWEIMPIVGDRSSPEDLIRNGLKKIGYSVSDDLFESISAVAQKNDGLIIFIDEMGKCLENSAKNDGDIYFFQKLAEYSSRSQGKIIFIGILHQAFAEYARRLPYATRDEWLKIQGRFVDMPVNTAGEEQISLIGKAIKTQQSLFAADDLISQVVSTISSHKMLVSSKTLESSLRACLPLNPVVVCLLAQISKRRFAQNQRSIFSFLSSREPNAFRVFLENTSIEEKRLYGTDDLYEYLKSNLESSILASTDSHLWNLAEENLSKCKAKGGDKAHETILKTITLIDMFGAAAGLSASKELLQTMFPGIAVNEVLLSLERWSLINFKKYIQSYSIFEGSDFDIEGALRDAYGQVTSLDLTKITNIANFRPVIAKRHYHKFGCMRWLDIIFASVDDLKTVINNKRSKSGAIGFFVILLPKNADEQEKAEQIINEGVFFDFPVVLTIAKNSQVISEYLKELLALEWILKNREELNGDNVAKKEINSRKNIINSLLENQLSITLNDANWSFNKEKLGHISYNKLSGLASDISDRVFYKTPRILSELVNRNKPSGSANAALNSLLKDMIINDGIPELGLSGFNPERSLFNILLRDTGIYTDSVYQEPKEENLFYLWSETDRLLKESSEAVSVEDIYAFWGQAPFGIKQGLFPFLLLSYMLSKRASVSLYKDNLYTPNITDTFVDYLLRVPKTISIKYATLEEADSAYIDAISHVLNRIQSNYPLKDGDSELAVARKLVSIVDRLPPWVLKTKTLTMETTKLREAIKSANDPHRLLFKALPKVFGVAGKLSDNKSKITKELGKALEELIEIYPATMKEIGVMMTAELDVPFASPKRLEDLRIRAKNIRDVSGNFRINAFASRISAFSGKLEDIAGIISLAISKPPHDWIDLDLENAKREILFLCKEFKKAELCSKIKHRTSMRQGVAFITGIGGDSNIIEGEFDVLNNARDEIDSLKGKLDSIATTVKDKNVLLAALTELSIKYLEQKND